MTSTNCRTLISRKKVVSFVLLLFVFLTLSAWKVFFFPDRDFSSFLFDSSPSFLIKIMRLEVLHFRKAESCSGGFIVPGKSFGDSSEISNLVFVFDYFDVGGFLWYDFLAQKIRLIPLEKVQNLNIVSISSSSCQFLETKILKFAVFLFKIFS